MGTKRKRNCEFSEEEYAKALFGEEIGSLVDDGGGDEGNGELRVFSSVFYRAHDLPENATSNDENVRPSDAIFSTGCVPFQSGNESISVIEYSCLPEGLESQEAKVRQVRLRSDIYNPDVTGESLEKNCGFLISESQKNLGTGLHHSGRIDASSEIFFVILNSKPAEITVDGCLHLVSPEVADGANEHSDKKEAMQHITGSVVESSADEPQETGNGSVLDTAFLDASSEKNFGILSSKAQKEIENGKEFGLDISSAKGVFAKEDRVVNFGHLNGKCSVSMGTGSKQKSVTEHSYLPVEVESHGAESAKVNLQTDIAGSIVIGVAYENRSGMSSSKEHFLNNSFCGSGPTGIPSDTSSGTLITKTEKNSGHNSMPYGLPNAIEHAIGTVDAGDTIHNRTDLVAESSIPDILSLDCSPEKPTAWNDKRCKGEQLDCMQSCQKALVTFDASGLDTQTPNDGLAKKAINAMVVITSPVSLESYVSKTSETNVLATIEDDMQPLNILGGNSEKRTREALLLMSDEVKTSWKKAFTAELRTRLWQNIKDFLVDAGFQVQYRHRPQRGAIDSVYVSPGLDRVHYASAVKAWKASAEMLFRGKKKTMLDSPTREWEDTTDFWAQLTDALALVEMEVERMGHKTAILKRWALLDPFVTMLFIERLEPLKARENVLMRSTKEPHGRHISKRLAKQGKSKLTMSCGDPFEFSLEPGLQLESDTAHSQLTDVLQADGSEDLGRSPVHAKTEGIAPVKGSSTSRKWTCPPGQNCAVQEVEMLSLEESPPTFPDISSETNPTLHVVNVTCMSKVHKDSGCVSAFSNVDDSQTVVAPSTVLDKEIRDQMNTLGKEPNQEGNPLGVEHKKVDYLGCFRSPCKKEEFHARGDDGVACQAGILSPEGKQKSGSKETMHAQPYRYPSCGSLQNSQFKAPRKMNRSCEKSKNPVPSDLSNLFNPNVEGEASVAYEAKDQFMVISKGQEIKSSKLLKKIHKSPADKKHKGTTKPNAASCLHRDASKVKNMCLHETRAFRKEAIIGDDGRKRPVRSPIDDRSSVHQASSKAVKIYECKASNEIGRKKIKDETVSAKKVCQINDDDLLIAAIIKNKDLGPNSPATVKSRKKTARTARKLKSYRGGCKLLLRSPGKGGRNLFIGKQSAFYKRTVLSWMIDSGALFENEIVRYQSKNGALVKDGWITRDGLLCKCCNMLFSLSEFKIHAGSKVGRSLLNLFVETGDSFTLCQLQAWSAEYKARKSGKRMVDDADLDLNDDTCGLCGDGGVLICCDNCPSTFHHACLGNQLLPDDNWYCPYCTCEICGEAVLQQDALGSSMLIQCVQCERKYHKRCLVDRLRCEGDDPTKETWFCGENCQEVHSGLRSHVGLMHHIGEGFSWTLLKCIQSDQRVHSAQGFALMAECNTKLAVALSIMEECFVPMIDPRTGIDMIPHALYNWGSCFTRLNYQGFYTMVLEKGNEIISVASIRVHGVVVAELPLVATCSEYRRQGMCRRLMKAIEEMLRSIKVERLVILAIPELIDTWTSAFGFKQMDDSDKELLNNISLMVFPGTTLLEKRLHSPQSFEQKEIEQANKKVGERPEELDPSWVLEPRKQAAEMYNDANDVGLELTQTNLRLEEASLNGSVLESAGEMDRSGTIIECIHQDDQNGNRLNGVVAESVHVNLQLPEASASDLMLKAAKRSDRCFSECFSCMCCIHIHKCYSTS